MTHVLIATLIGVAFLIGLLAHTPPQACALDAECARAPVDGGQ